MDVDRLRVLRELADRGSVTAVATALGFTPSAISQQLKALAREVGVALTEPAGRGLRLTAAGQALVTEAEAVLDALARADAAVERIRTVPQGPVRVALFPSLARVLLAGLLWRFEETEIELICHDIDMTPGDVPALAADYDVVITHRDERAEPAVETANGRWTVRALLHEPLDVALPAGHPLARRRRLRLDELANDVWISVQIGWPVDDVLRSLAARTGSAPRIAHRINDFAVTEELVAAGHGIALLPRYSTHHRGRKVVLRPLTGVRAERRIEAVLRTSTARRPSVALVLDALHAEADAITAARR